MQKNNNENFCSKREDAFLAHEKVLAQDQGGEKHFLFFKKKKRKVDQKNTFLKERFIKRTHVFSVFFFFWCIFSLHQKKLKKRNKTADETCENLLKKREILKTCVMFLLKRHFFFCERIDTKRHD